MRRIYNHISLGISGPPRLQDKINKARRKALNVNVIMMFIEKEALKFPS